MFSPAKEVSPLPRSHYAYLRGWVCFQTSFLPSTQIIHLFWISCFPSLHSQRTWAPGLLSSPFSHHRPVSEKSDALALFSLGLLTSEGVNLLSTNQHAPMGAPLSLGGSLLKGRNPAFDCLYPSAPPLSPSTPSAYYKLLHLSCSRSSFVWALLIPAQRLWSAIKSLCPAIL